MRKSDLQMECSFRGLPTKGDRSILISRLMKTLDDDNDVKPKGHAHLQNLDPSDTSVLRVKGHTTPNSEGVGVGLVLYHSETNEELWSGRIYCPGDRAGFEAEYSAIIMGLDFCKSCGIQNLVLQSTNNAIVFQINGIYKVSKQSLKPLLEMEKEHEEEFDSFSVAAIPNSENTVASELATKALSTRRSADTPKFWKFNDPILTLSSDVVDADVMDVDTIAGEEIDLDNDYTGIPQPAEIDPSRVYLLRFDGGSRGNPGVAGAGMVIYDDQGNEIWNGWKFHSESATNNVAEYSGLLWGLKCACSSLGITQLIAEGDSQLIVKQLNGEYRVKDAMLKKYHKACVDVAGNFEYFEIRHIPRAENSRADWLANHAMDLQQSHGCGDEEEDLGF
ncbi:unnamed protein product [Cylindrotheca closterium]|uniref:RNase H type-1 domain-containing protein n=1 Tax=Cylindrotheca closterium TaxID=2856 RepID=A0AAD2FZB1_9STRA|nr:unnamed protein product [Cylindrotheca closterium]